jgi:mono/diheme cytochrome c family protein
VAIQGNQLAISLIAIKLAAPDAGTGSAIAIYVKDVSAKPSDASRQPEQAFMDAGKAIFSDSCSGCHQANGEGVERMFPPLTHNANVQSAVAM